MRAERAEPNRRIARWKRLARQRLARHCVDRRGWNFASKRGLSRCDFDPPSVNRRELVIAVVMTVSLLVLLLVASH